MLYLERPGLLRQVNQLLQISRLRRQAPPVATGTTATQGISAYPDDVETFPLPVTEELVRRGKERYEIFCSTCHGMTGNGDGMVVRRGLRRAASFHADNLRQAPVGHFFDAITNGWGAMPSYAPQIPAQRSLGDQSLTFEHCN